MNSFQTPLTKATREVTASHRVRTAGRRGAVATTAIMAASASLSACAADDSDSLGGLKGDPIVVMATSSVDSQLVALPQFLEVIKAYAESVNDGGGIDGRPLKITTCDNQAAPAQTVACARQAVSDKAVAAVGWAIESPAFLKVLDGANIPWVTGVAHTPESFAEDISFPVTIGSIFQGMGQVAAAVKEGCGSVSLITNENFVAQAEQQESAAGKQGIDVKIVTYPTTASDAAPYIAKAAGSDCLIIGSTSDTFVAQLGVAIPQSGVSFTQIISAPTLSSELASQHPETWEGAVIAGTVTDQGNDAWAEFRDAVEEYVEVDADKHPPALAQPEWVSMSVVTNAIRSIAEKGDDVDAASVRSALEATTAAESDLTGPPLNFAQESDIPDFPRLFAPFIGFATVSDGKVVPGYDGEYHDISAIIAGEKLEDEFFQPSS